MIEHKGTILSITNNRAEISLQQTSACATCHAHGTCLSYDKKERLVTVDIQPHKFIVGEEVLVTLSNKSGYRAVLLSYVIPSILILCTLFLCDISAIAEWQSALLAVVVAAIYYIVLMVVVKKLKTTVSFRVEKLNNT